MANIELIEEFLEVEHSKSNTIGAYRYNLIKFGQYLGKDFTKALPKDLKLYIKNILVNEYAQQSLNQHVASIKGLYGYLYENNYIDKDYSLFIKVADSKVVPQAKEGKEYFNIEEIKRLIESVDNSPYVKKVKHKDFLRKRDVCLLTMIFKLGLRESEVRETKISDIDFENNKITIQGNRRKNGQSLTLPLDLEMIGRIQQYLTERKLITSDTESEMFTSITGKKLHCSDMTRMLKKRVSESGLEEEKTFYLHTHMLRKSCSMGLQSLGMSLAQTAKVLGQKTAGSVVFSNYTFLEEEEFIQKGIKIS